MMIYLTRHCLLLADNVCPPLSWVASHDPSPSVVTETTNIPGDALHLRTLSTASAASHVAPIFEVISAGGAMNVSAPRLAARWVVMCEGQNA